MERLLNFFTPENYQLDLRISRQAKKLSGTVIIKGQTHSSTVKFHAKDLKIFEIKNQNFTYDGETIIIENQTPETSATYEISFETALKNNLEGCYLSTYQYEGHEEIIATTQFESHYARNAFPCIDEPAAKATFDLKITVEDLEAGDIVLANTPLESQTDNIFTFETTPRMSTYLLAWVIGKFQKVETTNKNGVKVATYAALNQPLESLTFANETAAKALEYFDQKFGQKYPLPKLDQVALPDFEAGAMENWGLVTYRETCLLALPNASLDDKKSVAITVTHELSHQWFGDLVTMAWWDDLWLNESFASVIEYYATDALYPEFNIWEDFFTGDCLAALRRDSLPGVQSVQQAVNDPAEIATLFDGAIVYAKGARLILMLIRLMTPEKFDQGIKDYFKKHAYQNTVGDDLWAALQPYASFDVKNFMHAWISKSGYPALEVSDDLKLESQSRFLVDNSSEPINRPLPSISDDLSGHYLLSLSDAQFQKTLANFDHLSLEQKLRLLIDRMLLAKTDRVAAASLLDLLPKFVNETSAPVWEILGTILGDLKLFCPPETDNYHNYQNYLRKTLKNRFDALDLGKLSDSNSIGVRNILLGAAYYSEYEPTLKKLADLYQPDVQKLDPELRSAIILAKLHEDDSVFAELLYLYQTTPDANLKSELLASLVESARSEEHQKNVLDLLSKPQIVRPQDHIFLYIYLLRNFRTREAAFNWLTENWDTVLEIAGEKSIEDYLRVSASAVRTPEMAQKFTNFFAQHSENPALKRAYKMAETEIASRLHLLATDTPAISAKLAE